MSRTATLSLQDDWRQRREKLLASGDQQFQKSQIRILDFMLRRYGDQLAAQRPARFPMLAPVYLNRRAIVVHQHLGGSQFAGIKTEGEARTRASKLLARMANSTPREAKPAAVTIVVKTVKRSLLEDILPSIFLFTERRLKFKLARVTKVKDPERILAAAENVMAFEKKLPETAVAYLHEIAAQRGEPDAMRAANLLLKCENHSALDYSVLAWRERVGRIGVDAGVERFEQLWLSAEHCERAAEKMREELASENSDVRRRAMKCMRQLGTLQDAGLFMDLMALPMQSDELDTERPELLATVRLLSGGTEAEI